MVSNLSTQGGAGNDQISFSELPESSADIKSYDVLGVPVSIVTPDIALQHIENWACDKRGRFICIRDVASLMVINENEKISDLHQEAAMITPDGMPLVIIGKLKGHPVERTCGPDLMDLVMKHSPRNGLKHYLYGGNVGVAERLSNHFAEKYPGAQIVGWECPPFRPISPEEDQAAMKRIADSDADVVWIGISSPKQDVWMREHYKKLPQTLIGVGAAFDFHSGDKRRAPVWMQKIMLESLYRLMREPRRLWRRYLILAPKFVARVALDAIFARK